MTERERPRPPGGTGPGSIPPPDLRPERVDRQSHNGRHVDAFHATLHRRNGAYDLRTPIVRDGRVVGWELRPDFLLNGCVKRGCRVRLYMDANGVPELEAGD